MKRVSNLFLFFIFFQSVFYAQKENNHWFFGSRAGISFSDGTPKAIEGRLATIEGTSVISDAVGNLLFYTDGSTVWDSTHNPMPNGKGLLGHESSTQSALIVPLPDSDSLFYIFTVGLNVMGNEFNYSIVDMSENGGFGDVISKNNFLLYKVDEKVAAVQRCNKNYWVLTHQEKTNKFYAYPFSSLGVGIPIISSIGITSNGWGAGEMKFSHDGTKLAVCHTGGVGAEVFDFDKNTGVVSNPIVLANGQSRYGACFSPDNTKLYMSNSEGPGGEYLVQYDMTAPDIAASETLITSSITPELNALQLAPDGKIYVARALEKYLSVINKPNELGVACNFIDTGLILLRFNGTGLPNFVSHKEPSGIVKDVSICVSNSGVLSARKSGANYLWSTGEDSQEITVSDSGTYIVEIDDHGCFFIDTFFVSLNEMPMLNSNDSDVLCIGQTLFLDATTSGASYLWQDASMNPTFQVTQDGTYWVEVQNACGIYSDTLSIEFEECNCFYVPNTFSPNGDGVNDAFLPILGCELTDYEMVVFDRWGEIIFESSNANNAWDGTYKGEDLPEGVYVYRIVYKEVGAEVMSVKEHGKVVLIR